MTKCGVLNGLLGLTVALFLIAAVTDFVALRYRKDPSFPMRSDQWRIFKPSLYTEQGQPWRRRTIVASVAFAVLMTLATVWLFYYPNDGSESACIVTPIQD